MVLLPLSLEIPTTLKKIDSECLTRKSNCDPGTDECEELARYPQAKCLKTCRDKPFAFHSWTNVLAWALAEVGPWATDFAFAHAHRVPLFDHEEFKKDLDVRIITLERTSRDSVSAHRVCAVLSAYMILPYVLLVVLVVLAVGSIAQALTSMLFPFFILQCQHRTCCAAKIVMVLSTRSSPGWFPFAVSYICMYHVASLSVSFTLP